MDPVEQLYLDHARELLRIAVLLVDDPTEAEEVVQEAFAGLVLRRRLRGDPSRAVAYLRTSVVNGGRSRLRRRRTERSYEWPTMPVAPSAEAVAERSELRSRVRAELAGLPRRQREVLVLRHAGGLSEREIAEALGIAPGSVKSHASRGLAALGRRLEADR